MAEIQIKDLIAGVKRQDVASFQQLFKMYFRQMTLFAEYFLLDRDVAEDMVQDIFSELWSSAEKLPEISNIKAYLFMLLKNRCLNQLKHLEVEDRYKQWLQEAQEYAELSEEDVESERLDKVYDTIELLPQQAKLIFKQCALEGRKYKDVAEELGISVHTVNTQMKRSYKFLRSRLGGSFLIILFSIS